MSFTIWLGPDRTVDLGPTFPVLKVFGEFGKLEPGSEYSALHGLVHVGTDTLPLDAWRSARQQADSFLSKHSDELSAEARNVLQQITRSGAR